MALGKPDDSTLRRLRECCTQLHSCLLTWRKTKVAGLKTGNAIVNAIIAEGSVPWSLHQDFEKCLGTLDDVIGTISSLTGNVQAVHRLVCTRAKLYHNVALQPMFHTLSSAQFVDHFEQILTAYSQELSLCRSVALELHKPPGQQDSTMVCLSMWRHEPYLDEHTRLLLEALLVDTDLR